MSDSLFHQGAEWMRERISECLRFRAEGLARTLVDSRLSLKDPQRIRFAELELRAALDMVEDMTLPDSPA